MSAETCGGNVVAKWKGKKSSYFLRDDRDAGICEHERYSLFRETPEYGRVHVYGLTLNEAIALAETDITIDRQDQGYKKQCCACGEWYSGNNHHCDEKKINRIEGGRKSHNEYRERTPSYYRRLKDGFRMLGGEPF